MAYRLPHVVRISLLDSWLLKNRCFQIISLTYGKFLISQVMGDRSGNIRWWDITTGHSSSFNTHREGIRRIKFSPVVAGDRSRGRIAVLFYDNTFTVYDLVYSYIDCWLQLFSADFVSIILAWEILCFVYGHSQKFTFFYVQDSQDPLANSLLQPQFPGTLVLELDWLSVRSAKDDPLVLCIAGADSSFRLIEVNMYVLLIVGHHSFLFFGFIISCLYKV